MQIGSIYIIRNNINNKVYIGQTSVDIKRRFLNHLSAARRGKDYVIGKAIRKYGANNFYIELLEECPIDQLNDKEKYYIEKYNATNNKYGYNISIGGNAVTKAKELNVSQILEMFHLGIPAYKIAKELHVGIVRITTILKSYNVKYGLELQKISKHTEHLICEIYNKGYGTMDICRKLNIDKGTVRKVLKNNNIRIRTKQETNKLRRNLLALEKVSHESLAVSMVD